MLHLWTLKIVKIVLKPTNKLDSRRNEKSIALSNLSIDYTWRNIKHLYNNNRFKVSAPAWNDKFELPAGSYSISDIQDYFEYIFKKHGENINNPLVRTYVNTIKNRITFEIKTGYYLELLTPETMKLLGSTENKITKDKSCENVPCLEVIEVVLVHCNIVNNDYQQDSRALFAFTSNKPFSSLLEISPPTFIPLKTFNWRFIEIEVWLTDDNSHSLEIEDKMNLTLLINAAIIKIR